MKMKTRSINGDQPMAHPARQACALIRVTHETLVQGDERRGLELGPCLRNRAFGDGAQGTTGKVVEQALQRLAHRALEVQQQPTHHGGEGQRPMPGKVLRTLAMGIDERRVRERLAQQSGQTGIELARSLPLFILAFQYVRCAIIPLGMSRQPPSADRGLN